MWCKFFFHFITVVNMNSLKHHQTFKKHPLIAGLLRRQVEHAASARRHAMLLLWLTALPASWISCLLSKGRTFSESPGSAGCCTLSELVGVLQPKPNAAATAAGVPRACIGQVLHLLDPSWDSGSGGRKKRVRAGEHSHYCYLSVSNI